MTELNRRELLKTSASFLLATHFNSLMGQPHGDASESAFDWIRYNRTLIAEAYNPPFYPSFDYVAEKSVAIASQLNCDSMRYPAASYLAYFPTKSGYPVHPDMQGDPMRETLRLLRKNNLRAMAYIPLNHPFMSVESKDPRYTDWTRRFADGKPMITEHYGFDHYYEGCLNSPVRNVIKALVEEVMTNYDYDVMYFDGPYQGMDHARDYCYCEHCEAAFQKRFGKKIPQQASMTLDETIEYTRWLRDDVVIGFFAEISAMVRSIRKVPILFNDTSLLSKSGQWRGRAIPVADGFMFEASKTPEQKLFNLQLGKSTGKVIWTYLGSHTEYNGEHTKDKHARGWFSYPVAGQELLLDGAVATTAGVGCKYWGLARLFYMEQGPMAYGDGRYTKETFDFQVKHQSVLRKLEHPAQVGILVGDQTIDWYKGETFVPDAYGNYFHGAFNVLKAMSFESEPFLDWMMSPEVLARYQMIYAPNVACLSDTQCDMLRQYVKAGGILVATHLTSVADEYGRVRKDFGLADVFGASFDDAEPYEYPDLYLKPAQGDLIPQDVQIMRLRKTTGEVLAETYGRGHHRNLGPAVLRQSIGKGQAIYIGSGLEAVFDETRMDPVLNYLASLINPLLEAKQTYVVDYVRGVTPHYMKSQNAIVLHLLADIGDKDEHLKTRETFLPVTNLKVKIRVPHAPRVVTLMRSGESLTPQLKDGWIYLTVPRVLIHEAIQVDLA